MKLILASKSPRRREILGSLGLSFEVITADTDESCDLSDPTLYVKEIAARKGKAVRDALLAEGRDLSDTVIISADTVVACDGKILGKPHSREEAKEMLTLLSGKTHTVISGVALFSEDKVAVCAEVTEVVFTEIDEKELSLYLDSDEPYDKAGAYAIQGFASLWISSIKGDYFNVVGFPTHRFRQMMFEEFRVRLSDLMTH